MTDLGRAIHSLYFASSDSIRQDANSWLERFQRSPQAWDTCVTQLSSETPFPELLLFCAQTLNAVLRVKYAFVEAHLSILLTLCNQYARASVTDPILVQLTLSLSTVLLNSPTVAQAFAQLSTELRPLSLLALLEVLPEQADSKVVPFVRRTPVLTELRASSLHVLQVLEHSASNGLRVATLPCLVAWIKHSLLAVSNLSTCHLFWGCLDALIRGPALDLELQVVLQALKAADNEPSTLLLLVTKTLPLAQRFLTVVTQKGHRHTEGRHYAYQLSSALRCAAKVSTAHLVRFLEEGSPVSPWDSLLESLIEVARSPFPEVASPAFDFWVALNEATCQNLRASQHLLGYLSRVFQAMIEGSKYPSDFASLSADERDAFAGRFRNDMRDTLREIVVKRPAQCHPDTFLRGIHQVLAKQLQSASFHWQSVESQLHALSAIAKAISTSENQFLPDIMSLLPRLPLEPGLLNTAVCLIGVCCAWLEAHPTSVPPAFHVLLKSLTLPEHHPVFPMRLKADQDHSACVSWVKLCGRPVIAAAIVQSGQLPKLSDMFINLLPTPTGTVSQISVFARSIILFLEGLCSLASRLPSPSALSLWLKSVNEALLLRIRTFVANSALEEQLSEMLALLRVLFVCTFKPSKGPIHEEVCSTIESNCVVLARILQTRRAHPRVNSEALSCLTAMLLPFRTPCALLSSMSTLFLTSVKHKTAPLHIALDSLRVLFSVTRVPYIGDLRSFLSELVGNVMQLCLDDWGTRGLDEDPEVPVAAFGLLEEAEQNLPGVLVSERLQPVLTVAVGAGLCVQHREVARSVIQFLSKIVQWAQSDEKSVGSNSNLRFRDLLLGPWGCLLFQRLLLFLFRPTSRSLLPEVVDVLWALRVLIGEAVFVQWLDSVLAENAEFPRNNKVRTRAREDLVSAKNQNKSKFKKLLKALCGGKLSE